MSNALQILGGLGVFLVGLRMMSDGLQKASGDRLRAVLAGMTQNRFSAVLSGFVVTCAVQSSSATTVLVVSFANAGLLTLMQSGGMVMGANIGTTLTAWIVSLLGFKVHISKFALPVIGIGFPLSLIDSRRTRHLSEIMVGFGLLFLGLAFLKAGVPNLKESPETLAFLQDFTGYGFGSTLLFVAVGTILTIIVQSSSASSAITLTMVANGWIGLDLAAAMILGENIGTTITAQLAAIGANRNARRVAHFHTLFNVIGVIWMLPVLSFVLALIQRLISGDPAANVLVATTQVALFHTLFNVANTVLLLGLLRQLMNLVTKLVPLKESESEGPHLAFLQTGLMRTPELVSVSARTALREMLLVCHEMFKALKEVILNPDQKLGKLVDHIKREEQRTDDMEEELVEFCTNLARAGTSMAVGRDVARFLEMANDIERIGDHCMNLVLLAERRWQKRYEFREAALADLGEMMNEVSKMLEITAHAFDPDGEHVMGDARILEHKINDMRNINRKRHAARMQEGDVPVRQGLIFLDMLTNMEKIGDYCWNVHQSLHQMH
ncbi:MAG: Na/Pi cotransporter family protein [Deltaproteobacteria bacterium]|nr:Na/Pi cotransporter family protein [Deltaproteobacteria bacterium]